MVPPAYNTTLDSIVDLPNPHVNDVLLSTIATSYTDAAIGTSVSETMVHPDIWLSTVATTSAEVANGTSVSDAAVPPSDDQ